MLLFAAVTVGSGSAFGWGCEGHQIIALIARAHLTPAASIGVAGLLRENPIDSALNRFCKDRPADPMADVSTWADDVKNVERTAEWHFIDIPIAVTADPARPPDLMKWCLNTDGKPDCIVSAIANEWAILRDRARSSADRAKALRYVIHLVGDLTQPLHAGDNRDRGGNCTAIYFFTWKKPENLHAIWDYKIIAKDLADRQSREGQYADAINAEFANEWQAAGALTGALIMDVPAWAWGSHALAVTMAYGALRPRIPVAPPEAGTADQALCNSERDAVQSLHIAVGEEYEIQILPVIRAQLAKAGYRLAHLLNETFQ
ncbi:MAG: S1/P1 nuclease [Acidobacteriota bacterium]|nr:S1/P1 nuclease [Acidobacteriota bacterium]